MNLLSVFGQTSNDIYAIDMANATTDAVIAGLMIFMILFTIAIYIVTSIMLARIFKKASVEGWKAWVPVYNTWMTLEIGGQKGWWAIMTLIPIVNIVAIIFLYIAMYNIGLHLGKDDYFVLWAIFLPIVWYAWLAYDKSTWNTLVITAISTPPTTDSSDETRPTPPAV